MSQVILEYPVRSVTVLLCLLILAPTDMCAAAHAVAHEEQAQVFDCYTYLKEGFESYKTRRDFPGPRREMICSALHTISSRLVEDVQNKENVVLSLIELALSYRNVMQSDCVMVRPVYRKGREIESYSDAWLHFGKNFCKMCSDIQFAGWDRLPMQTIVSNYYFAKAAVAPITASQNMERIVEFARSIWCARDRNYNWARLLERCLISAPDKSIYGMLEIANNEDQPLTLFERYVHMKCFEETFSMPEKEVAHLAAVCARLTDVEFEQMLEKLRAGKASVYAVVWHPSLPLFTSQEPRIIKFRSIWQETMIRLHSWLGRLSLKHDTPCDQHDGEVLFYVHNGIMRRLLSLRQLYEKLIAHFDPALGAADEKQDDTQVALDVFRTAHLENETGYFYHGFYSWESLLYYLNSKGIKPNTLLNPDDENDKRTLFSAYVAHHDWDYRLSAMCKMFSEQEFMHEMVALRDSDELRIRAAAGYSIPEKYIKKGNCNYLKRLLEVEKNVQTYLPTLFERLLPEITNA